MLEMLSVVVDDDDDAAAAAKGMFRLSIHFVAAG
jgi:hypothetical protein